MSDETALTFGSSIDDCPDDELAATMADLEREMVQDWGIEADIAAWEEAQEAIRLAVVDPTQPPW